MQKLTREDLYSLEQYAEARDEFRARVLEHKRDRRIELGTNAALMLLSIQCARAYMMHSSNQGHAWPNGIHAHAKLWHDRPVPRGSAHA